MSNTAQAAVFNSAETETPTLTLINNQPRASSVDVAAHFGKSHKNVLSQIRNILKACPEEWGRLNFQLISNITDLGHATRKDPAYSMTRDGFTLLAMGFTGSKALQFKLAWLEAFSRMEAELAGRSRDGNFTLTSGPSAPPALDGPSDIQTRRPLNKLIAAWINQAPVGYRDAWHQVKAHFQVEKAEHLTLAQVKEACVWVQERIDRLGPAHRLPVLPGHDPAIVEELKELKPATTTGPGLWVWASRYSDLKYKGLAKAISKAKDETARITGKKREDQRHSAHAKLLHFLCEFEEMARSFPEILKWLMEMDLILAEKELRLAKIAQAMKPDIPDEAA